MKNRRYVLKSLAAIAAVAFPSRVLATAQCTTGNCSGNQVCCEGYICSSTGNGSSKTCKPYDEHPDTEPCEHDGECAEGCVCGYGVCGVVINNVFSPTIVINRRRRRKHHHHKRHHKH